MYIEFTPSDIYASFAQADTPREVDAALKTFEIEPVDSEAHRRPDDPDEWPTWSGVLTFNSSGDPGLWYRGTDPWPVQRETLRRLLHLLLDVPWPLEIVGGAIALWLDHVDEEWVIQISPEVPEETAVMVRQVDGRLVGG